MRLTCQVSFEVSLLGYFVRLVCEVSLSGYRCLWKAGEGRRLYAAFYTLLSRPCIRFTVILRLTGFLS